MRYKCADEYRDAELLCIYDAILKVNLRSGISYEEARQRAYDAAALRFTLSVKRIKTIINSQIKKAAPNISALLQQNLELINNLSCHNDFLREEIERNDKLIDVLNTANEYYKTL